MIHKLKGCFFPIVHSKFVFEIVYSNFPTLLLKSHSLKTTHPKRTIGIRIEWHNSRRIDCIKDARLSKQAGSLVRNMAGYR